MVEVEASRSRGKEDDPAGNPVGAHPGIRYRCMFTLTRKAIADNAQNDCFPLVSVGKQTNHQQRYL